MNLDRIAIRLRPRSIWQAMDLGVVLARRWYWPLCRLWLITTVPLLLSLVACGWLFPGPAVKWTICGFWLLQPLCEPLMLAWAGQTLFGDRRPISEVVRRWRFRGERPGFWTLLRCRCRPLRPLILPVLILERLKGQEVQQRVGVLSRGQDGVFYLTFSVFLIELLLVVSQLSLAVVLIPEELRWFSTGEALLMPNGWFLLAAYAASSLFVTPFYICCGFMLYINRRVTLEAWDIEVGFRAINSRIEERRR